MKKIKLMISDRAGTGTKVSYTGKIAIVDDEDWDRVRGYSWRYFKAKRKNKKAIHEYARAQTEKGRVFLHRFILDAPKGSLVDHVNGDGLNCRRLNMRLGTHSDNLRNRRKYKHSSKYTGVGWNRWRKCWTATVGYKGRLLYLGTFKTEREAAMFRDDVASKLFGNFHNPNLK